ncbi:MAG: hypothetical protein KIT45_08165 [Fimbriimonadia bacterium]|nr:hypothetical protein [Fimbriimonadia bacterium]
MRWDDYLKLRKKYIDSNQYLDLFGLAPRVFGEVWAHEHIRSLDLRFQIPNKAIDPNYDGEYDLWIERARVEVKASRAVRKFAKTNLSEKALHSTEQAPFLMNFQQLKPQFCDVFLFVGVWIDKIRYWVLSSVEAENIPYFSRQHRGGIEYQIIITHKNITQFAPYEVEEEAIAEAAVLKAQIE